MHARHQLKRCLDQNHKHAQGMAFSVAMNSKRANAIVALLIASNFAEIKGVVFKRFDARRLLILSCMVPVVAPCASVVRL